MDVDKFKADKADTAARDIIARDLADADALGLDATPTFFVNGKQIGSTAELDSAIAAALK
jgi:protein-disulfide isomerase